MIMATFKSLGLKTLLFGSGFGIGSFSRFYYYKRIEILEKIRKDEESVKVLWEQAKNKMKANH